MWPPSPYAKPVSSFPAPVSPPSTLPTDTPLIGICINVDWLPFICGALQQLLLQSTWIVSTDEDLTDLQSKVVDLISLFNVSTAPDCGSTAMFRQPDNCTLQYSSDGGSTWNTVFDASTCATEAANTVVAGDLADTRIAPPQQQPPATSFVSGQCYEYDVLLDGKATWLSPIAISADDTVEISDARGGWNDGSFVTWIGGDPPIATANFSAWTCPSGAQYLFGGCSGGEEVNPGDPKPDSYHMRLVMNLGAVWYDAYDQQITAPAGITDQLFWLQANDYPIDDNGGSIEFHVKICKAGSVVCEASEAGTIGIGWPEDGKFRSGVTYHVTSTHRVLDGYDVETINFATLDSCCMKVTMSNPAGFTGSGYPFQSSGANCAGTTVLFHDGSSPAYTEQSLQGWGGNSAGEWSCDIEVIGPA